MNIEINLLRLIRINISSKAITASEIVLVSVVLGFAAVLVFLLNNWLF